MKSGIYIFLSLFFISSSFSQVLKVQTKVDYKHLSTEEQEELRELADKINDYYNNYAWTEDEYETDIGVNIHVIVENVRKKSHEKIFKTQFQIRSESGESFYDKEFEFPYHRNYPLEHNKVQFDPITKVLDFYANMILAGELDTYDLMLGTPFYDVALDIASQGSYSQYTTGWSSRLKEHEKVTNIRTRPLREAKPDFFEALFYLDEGNIKEARKYAKKVLTNIEKVYKNQPNNKYLKLFFDAHYKELAQLFRGNVKVLQDLEIYDPLHKSLYREFAKQ
jgi:Domain of unknown function (DUF4835)